MQGGTGTDRARRSLAYLRSRIASGEWAVNEQIPTEPELMELLGVGKTTVREAVRTLANLGMLEALPGRGTFVRSRVPVSSVLADYIADFEVPEILGYRRALELEAAQQAARNRTAVQLDGLRAALANDRPSDPDLPVRWERGRTPGQFHFLVLEATGSALLTGLYAGVMAALRRAVDAGVVVYGASHEVRTADHERILAAIEAGDPVAAAHAMSAHLDHDLVPEKPADA
ncbi:FadR/GntR family transcriptional regulator [Propionicimonas sp.]|uniref:FadR/GntR family transcriptional regulator n=1 Tax=Propionicimonas sp. TaxID=1955623 RepID=UPI0039E60221